MLLSLLVAAHAAPLLFPNAPDPSTSVCPLTAIEVAFTGDVMMHGMQVKAARRPDGTYSMRHVFDPLAPYIQAPDLAIANLETTIAGEELRFTGFPRFNSPAALLVALKEAGFDSMQTANNHCLDRDEVGVLRTLDAVQAHGMTTTGTYRSRSERDEPWTMLEAEGVRVAFIGYTFSTNGIEIPPDKPWMVNMLDEGKMERDVTLAKRAGADLVIVGIHWGAEYKDYPEPWVARLADRMVDAGADVVMGGHPHVVQPVVVRTATDDIGRPRDGLIMYSLGNFVSNQRSFRKDGGVLVRATVLHCAPREQTWLSNVRFTPFWVDDHIAERTRGYTVFPTQPFGHRCDTVVCRRMARHRDHLATLLPASQFDWTVAPQTTTHVNVEALGFDPTGAWFGDWSLSASGWSPAGTD